MKLDSNKAVKYVDGADYVYVSAECHKDSGSEAYEYSMLTVRN